MRIGWHLSGSILPTGSVKSWRLTSLVYVNDDAIQPVLNGIKDLETQAEGIRRLILSFMASVALGKGKSPAKAVNVIDCFRLPYYDSGRAGLILSCFDAIQKS